MDRDLQKAIAKGSRLKKTVTNDRSAPVCEAAKSGGGGGGGGGGGSGGGMGGPLFSGGGMPQLRPTGPRSDIRPSMGFPKSGNALPSANSGNSFGPKFSTPPSRPVNSFGNGPIPPPPPRETPGPRPMTTRPPAPGPVRTPAPFASNARVPPPSKISAGMPSRPAPPSGFKSNPPPAAPVGNSIGAKASPFGRPSAPPAPPNFKSNAATGAKTSAPPISSQQRTPSFGAGATKPTHFGGGLSGGKIPTPPPNIPGTANGSVGHNAVPPPPGRSVSQKPFVSNSTNSILPSSTQSVPASREHLPALPSRGPPHPKQDLLSPRSQEFPPPPSRSNPTPPVGGGRGYLGKKPSVSDDTSPQHPSFQSLPANRHRNAAPPPPPPSGKGNFKSSSPPPMMSNRGAPPVPPARASTPPLNNAPPLPDRDRMPPPNRAFSPNGSSRPAPAPPGNSFKPVDTDLEKRFNFPRDLPQPISFKSAPKTYPSRDQDPGRNRPGRASFPAPIVTDPTKRPPPPPPPV